MMMNTLMNTPHPTGTGFKLRKKTVVPKRLKHVPEAEMWLIIIGLFVLIGVMVAVGYYLF